MPLTITIIIWIILGIAAYGIYNKFNIIDDSSVEPTMLFFTICIVFTPLHLCIIPGVTLFKKVNSILRLEKKPKISFIGNSYKVIDVNGLQHTACNPIANGNVIKVHHIDDGSDQFAKVHISRVEGLSTGNYNDTKGYTYLDEFRRAIKQGNFREITPDEKLLLSID